MEIKIGDQYELQGNLQLEISWASCLRILAWFLLSMLVLKILSPTPEVLTPETSEKLSESNVVKMLLKGNSKGWIRSDFDTFPGEEGQKSVAWISGSSTDVLREVGQSAGSPDPTPEWTLEAPDTVEALVNEALLGRSAQRTRIYSYSWQSRRAMDTYTMVRDALKRNPDVLVLTLNPFWEFNDKAIFFRKSLFIEGAKLWWNKEDWAWQFAMLPPRYHFAGSLWAHIPLPLSSQGFMELAAGTGGAFVHRSGDPVLDTPVDMDSQPIHFWMMKKDGLARREPGYQKKENWRQLRAMSVSKLYEGSIPLAMLDNTVRLIEDSSIPALIYLAPLSPEVKKSRVARRVHRKMRAHLRRLESRYASESLKIIPDLPNSVTAGLVYRDYIHLTDPQGLPEYFADLISSLEGSR